ncbi:hypothetical protein EDD85DRAFT_763209 [Armillaria nabsnona]|nr:hypothetical protein EDD85DRAFT_763209 [Armillaria nabsnona]
MFVDIRVSLLFAAVFLGVHGTPTPSKPLFKRDAIPSYVLTYAPYTYLYSGETYWSSDISVHLQHTTPEVDFASLGFQATLQTLNSITTDAYLTSNDNVETNPAWLLSTSYKPNSSGYSTAPATIICVEKDGGIVDAFYFYFYSFNRGNTVLGIRFGNHVGDWEHTMVRFVNGSPQYVYLSAHSGGTSYTYNALGSQNGRAITYVATGTHANYATAGEQDYTLPFGLLHDTTDAGFFWDVTKNYRGFWYDVSSGDFSSAGGVDVGGSEQGSEGVSWLDWLGLWGDEQYPDSDSRQYCLFGQCHYVSGPTGPLAKHLDRTDICPDAGDCDVQTSISSRSIETRAGGADGTVFDEYAEEFAKFKAEVESSKANYTF